MAVVPRAEHFGTGVEESRMLRPLPIGPYEKLPSRVPVRKASPARPSKAPRPAEEYIGHWNDGSSGYTQPGHRNVDSIMKAWGDRPDMEVRDAWTHHKDAPCPTCDDGVNPVDHNPSLHPSSLH